MLLGLRSQFWIVVEELMEAGNDMETMADGIENLLSQIGGESTA